MSTYNEKFMQRAVELSEMAYKSGKGLPIGCVIVKDGKIIGEGHNEIFIRNNPTAHAEMVAIEDACKKTGNLQLEECDLYTSLEPCPMCFGAVYWAKLRTVYFANTKQDATRAGFDDSFILGQIQKPHAEQWIPMLHFKMHSALKILEDWKSKNPDASQAWVDKK